MNYFNSIDYYHQEVAVRIGSQVAERHMTLEMRKFQEKPWNVCI